MMIWSVGLDAPGSKRCATLLPLATKRPDSRRSDKDITPRENHPARAAGEIRESLPGRQARPVRPRKRLSRKRNRSRSRRRKSSARFHETGDRLVRESGCAIPRPLEQPQRGPGYKNLAQRDHIRARGELIL